MHEPSDTPALPWPTRGRTSIATSEEDSIATSPSTATSQSQKRASQRFEQTNSVQDTSDFVFIEEESNTKMSPCEDFHSTGYCPLGFRCKYQHQDRGVKQIRREMRSQNPIHFLNEYPDLMYWRGSIDSNSLKPSKG